MTHLYDLLPSGAGGQAEGSFGYFGTLLSCHYHCHFDGWAFISLVQPTALNSSTVAVNMQRDSHCVNMIILCVTREWRAGCKGRCRQTRRRSRIMRRRRRTGLSFPPTRPRMLTAARFEQFRHTHTQKKNKKLTKMSQGAGDRLHLKRKFVHVN